MLRFRIVFELTFSEVSPETAAHTAPPRPAPARAMCLGLGVVALAYTLSPLSGVACSSTCLRAHRLQLLHAPAPSVHACPCCGQPHPSRNKLYAHLRDSTRCGDASGLDLAAGRPVKLRKHLLSVGYGATCGGEAAASLLRDRLEAVEGVPLQAMTRASDWRFRRSPLLRQLEHTPSVGDVMIYSSATRGDATAHEEGEAKQAWLERLNSQLASHGVVVFDRQLASAAGQKLHAERDCTGRTYECLLPLSYLETEEVRAAEAGREVAADMALMARLKPFLRALSSPKSATHGGYRGRRAGAQSAWLADHAWHNFATEAAVPTDAAVRRTVDRFWVCDAGGVVTLGPQRRRFVRLRISADGLLQGQVERMVGAAVCMLHGWLPASFAEAALSPRRILPTPAVPTGLVLLREVRFDWHHKGQSALRVRSRQAEVQAAILTFEEELVAAIVASEAASVSVANAWRRRMQGQVCPAIVRQMAQHERRNALVAKAAPLVSATLRTATHTSECPPMYDTVLRLLREADVSGAWPSTSRARGRVIAAADATTSGSFSAVSPVCARAIGAAAASSNAHQMQLPRQLPRGNKVLPDLIEAVFELEGALAPGRPPSTMVAINRRASFQPHTDAGAGLGQTTSLIVGLGEYTGGELAVEGTVVPIRYAPHEFDGWRSRHWTLPFVGERFSLVWFTPAVEGDGGERYAL